MGDNRGLERDISRGLECDNGNDGWCSLCSSVA